jgi:GNAT superfamily N-acetyltransferase
MPQFEIRVFDPQTASPELWASYHACRRAVAIELRPDDAVLSDAEFEIEERRDHPLYDCVRWVAIAGQDVAGFASAFFRRPGSPNSAAHAPHIDAGAAVRAESRRKGAGTLLLREVLGLMHKLGKTILTLGAHTEPGHSFLRWAGAEPKLTNISSRAALRDLDWDTLSEWEGAAGECGLEWERHAGRVPREVLLGLLPEFTALFADMPLGELEIPPIRVEIEGYDQWYEMLGRTGGAHHLILLREAGGGVAGLSEATWDARRPSLARQQLTAVARPWRGRGLAKAMKAAMLRQIRENHPKVDTMSTGNAEMNAAMRSINARVGFKMHRRFVEYQAGRDALDLWSSARAHAKLFIT